MNPDIVLQWAMVVFVGAAALVLLSLVATMIVLFFRS